MQSKIVLEVLCCPICGDRLQEVGSSVQCGNKHSFDISRQGYLNLIPGGKTIPSAGGDTSQQLLRRKSFSAGGNYDFIKDKINAKASVACSSTPACVIDAASGTGFYLAALLESHQESGRDSLGVGIDVSKDAAKAAARSYPNLSFVVADVWDRWPVRSQSVDLVLNIFGPRNINETARVLKPSGAMISVYPGPDHLIELRKKFDLMDIQPAKESEISTALLLNFSNVSSERVRVTRRLDKHAVQDVVMMGPNGTRSDLVNLDSWAEEVVTYDVNIATASSIRRKD